MEAIFCATVKRGRTTSPPTGRLLHTVQHALEGRPQVEGGDVVHHQERALLRRGLLAGDDFGAGEDVLLHLRPHPQFFRHRLVAPVLDQPRHQLRPRIAHFLFVQDRAFRLRQQHPRLDLHQLRRHHQELAGHFEIQGFERGEILQILPRDVDDGDVEDVDVFAVNQIQQQIERTLKDRQRHRMPDEDAVGRNRHALAHHRPGSHDLWRNHYHLRCCDEYCGNC